MKFKVRVEKSDDGWFVVTVPSLPGCVSQGKTKKEALENIKEAIELHLSSLAIEGVPVKKKRGYEELLVAVSL